MLTKTALIIQKHATVSFEQIHTKNEITPRSSHGMSVIDNKIIVFGGENEARTPIDSALNVFDYESKSWEEVAVSNGKAPSHRVAHAQAVVGKKLYVFGGRQGIGMDEKPLSDL